MVSTTTRTRASAARTPIPVQEKPQPHRFRVSVPQADEAVLEWMALQDNPSLSVRMLIRESIERLGYVDIVNKPVAQLPKRGRPSGTDDGTDDSPEASAQRFPPVPATNHHQAAAVTAAPADADAPTPPVPPTELDLSTVEPPSPELLSIALQPSAEPDLSSTRETVDDAPIHPAQPSAPTNPEQPVSGQQDVNDIFGALRT